MGPNRLGDKSEPKEHKCVKFQIGLGSVFLGLGLGDFQSVLGPNWFREPSENFLLGRHLSQIGPNRLKNKSGPKAQRSAKFQFGPDSVFLGFVLGGFQTLLGAIGSDSLPKDFVVGRHLSSKGPNKFGKKSERKEHKCAKIQIGPDSVFLGFVFGGFQTVLGPNWFR